MEIIGTIQKIHPPYEDGKNEKQYFTLKTSDSIQIELLLFNRTHLVNRFEQGESVKLLYNHKQKEVGGKTFIDN